MSKSSSIQQRVFDDVKAERDYQDGKWGTIEQNPHTRREWVHDILREEFNEAAELTDGGGDEGVGQAYRHELVQVAAVAIAAIEQFDGQAASSVPVVVSDLAADGERMTASDDDVPHPPSWRVIDKHNLTWHDFTDPRDAEAFLRDPETAPVSMCSVSYSENSYRDTASNWLNVYDAFWPFFKARDDEQTGARS